jgi:hypothetical protein
MSDFATWRFLEAGTGTRWIIIDDREDILFTGRE